MPRLTLDFASAQRPLAGPKPYLRFGLLLTGALILAAVAWKHDQQIEVNAALGAQRDRLSARVQRQQPQERVPAELSAQLEHAATAHAQIVTAWDDLFRALETSKGGEIILLSVTADAARKEFALSGEAKDFAALSHFSDLLSSSPMFRRAVLSSHKLSEGAPPIVVRFDLAVAWRAPVEARR